MGQARKRGRELQELNQRRQQSRIVRTRQAASWQMGELVRRHQANEGSDDALGQSLKEMLGRGAASAGDIEAIGRVVDLGSRRGGGAGKGSGKRANALGDNLLGRLSKETAAAGQKALDELDVASLDALMSEVLSGLSTVSPKQLPPDAVTAEGQKSAASPGQVHQGMEGVERQGRGVGEQQPDQAVEEERDQGDATEMAPEQAELSVDEQPGLEQTTLQEQPTMAPEGAEQTLERGPDEAQVEGPGRQTEARQAEGEERQERKDPEAREQETAEASTETADKTAETAQGPDQQLERGAPEQRQDEESATARRGQAGAPAQTEKTAAEAMASTVLAAVESLAAGTAAQPLVEQAAPVIAAAIAAVGPMPLTSGLTPTSRGGGITAREATVTTASEIAAKVAAGKQPLQQPRMPSAISLPPMPKKVSVIPTPPAGQTIAQPSFTINARGNSGPVPALPQEMLAPDKAGAAMGADMNAQRNVSTAAEADAAVVTARAKAEQTAASIPSEAARVAAGNGSGAVDPGMLAQTVAPTGGQADPARIAAMEGRKTAIQGSAGQLGAARLPTVPTQAPLEVTESAPSGAAAPTPRAPEQTAATVSTEIQQDPSGLTPGELARVQPAMGGSAASRTATPQGQAPDVQAVSRPGGDSVPAPRAIVQPTVSLSSDRSGASTAIAAEAATQSRLATEASTQRSAQFSPLPGEAQSSFNAATVAPRAQTLSQGRAQGAQVDAQGQAGVASEQVRQAAITAANAAKTAAEQAAEAARPKPQAITEMTSATMTAATATAESAAAAIRAQAAPQPFMAPPGTQSLTSAGAGVASSIAARTPDLTRAQGLQQLPPLPDGTPGEGLTVDALVGPELQQARSLSQDLKVPDFTFPAPPSIPGGGGPDGAPTREQAIAKIEGEIGNRMQSEGPPAMESRLGGLRQEMDQYANQGQALATDHLIGVQSQAAGAMSQAAAHAQPVTADQANQIATDTYRTNQVRAQAAADGMTSDIEAASAQARADHDSEQLRYTDSVGVAGEQFRTDLRGTWLPQYDQAHVAADQEMAASHQAAQGQLAARQAAAAAQAQARTAQEEAATQARLASERAAVDAQSQAADASFQARSDAAHAQHEANVSRIQTQTDTDVAAMHAQSAAEVSRLQSSGNQEVESHLREGEQEYQRQMEEAARQAEAEKQRADAEAARKRQEAEQQKQDKSWLERAVDAVTSAVRSLLDAAINILKKARDAVINIMERARSAALSALNRFRQLALDALKKVKDAIQGAISAVADAVRATIQAAAQLIKSAIQATADFLKACVQELTNVINGLIEVFQTVVNSVLDGLIAAVSFINEDWGRALDDATSGYRQAFNDACDKAQETIQTASTALQDAIQQGADVAKAAVDVAEQALEAAVTNIENNLHARVEAAYDVAVAAVNTAFDAAEAAVNVVFDLAEAAVEAYFDAYIAVLQVVDKVVEIAGEIVAMAVHAWVESICMLVDALVELIPDSVKEWFIDFWNGPWRDIIVIGLVTIAAVAITVATMGTGAPVAAMLVAGVIGATLGGAAFFGGELAARNAEQDLERDHDQLYVPGFGYVDYDPATGTFIDPKTGQALPPGTMPEGMSADQFQWAMSNFDVDENGELAAKSGEDLFDYASLEGLEGAIQGGISSAMAMSGGAAGAWTSGIQSTFWKGAATKGIQAGLGFATTLGKDGSLTYLQAIEAGKSPSEAWDAALDKMATNLTPEKLAETLITTAVGIGLSHAQSQLLEGALKSQLGQSLLNITVSTGVDTLKGIVGKGGAAYLVAVASGKSQSEALALAEAAAGQALDPKEIVKSLLDNIAGEIAAPSKTQQAKAEEEAAAAAAAKAKQEAEAEGPNKQPASSDAALEQLKAMSYEELVALPQIGDVKATKLLQAIENGEIQSWADVDALGYFGPKTMEALGESLDMTGSYAGYKSDEAAQADFKAKFGDERYAEYEAMVQAAQQLHPELKAIPMEDLVALRGYTSNDYDFINKALRSGNPAELAQVENYIKTAASGLNEMPTYEGTVYRGTKLPPDAAAKYQAGETVTEAAFTSSAASNKAAFDGDTLFVINSKTGHDVSMLSVYGHEQEVLFSPGTSFKVLKVEVDPVTGFRTIYMSEE